MADAWHVVAGAALTISIAAVAVVLASPSAPQGPMLDAIRARGELVVSVREYARPAPPGKPAPIEPDSFDVSLARFLAERLHVSVRVSNTGPVDLNVAGTAPASLAPAVPTPYTGGDGAVVALRGSAYARIDDLRHRTVCVAQGSPYASVLAQRIGAVPRAYASAIRAISAFMAGECQALADDEVVIARLLSLPEWRFYRRLASVVRPDAYGAEIAMRVEDPVSAVWLDDAVKAWRTSGALSQARMRRAGDIAFEVGQLQDGLGCHS